MAKLGSRHKSKNPRYESKSRRVALIKKGRSKSRRVVSRKKSRKSKKVVSRNKSKRKQKVRRHDGSSGEKLVTVRLMTRDLFHHISYFTRVIDISDYNTFNDLENSMIELYNSRGIEVTNGINITTVGFGSPQVTSVNFTQIKHDIITNSIEPFLYVNRILQDTYSMSNPNFTFGANFGQ